MSIKKQANGKYLADFRPNGIGGVRVRKLFDTQGEAKRFEQYTLNEAEKKAWQPNKVDNRRLDELIELWFNLHGQALNDCKKRKNKLLAMSLLMQNPIARNITASDFSKYRQLRIKTVSIKTVNNEQTYLNALFNELKRLGEWKHGNPLSELRALKYKQPEMGFLKPEEIKVVFDELKQGRNYDAYLISKICISTGCRWGEAESLTGSQLSPYRVTFIHTKGNKRRAVPISEELYNELPQNSGRLFSNCIKSFKMAVDRAGIVLPKGQSTHVLRHTFSSHFMMNGGNILVLQQILGHASITDTMKYAHFSPAHLEDAIKLNPLSTVGK
ncbi:phage integrase [Psychromonas aquimarina]|uniref:phage integrase n=1 Tax=Psychromonas aquimarina TaxID=444919 RepID=UPI0003F956A4|nr:tyrosine-type recombinase/integrase [Psychromonas aquimarina]